MRHPFENTAAAANEICFGRRHSQADGSDRKQSLFTDRATAGAMTMEAPLIVGCDDGNPHEILFSPARDLRSLSKKQATIAGYGAAGTGMLHRGPPPAIGFSKMQAGEVAGAINGILRQRGQR
jgi:hypothetical protein